MYRVFTLAVAGLLLCGTAIALRSDFPRSLANVLVSEGGNDNDPRDPGGRTSRGIIQREWNVWRRTHPGLPADVWKAPQDQVEAIYLASYWNSPCVRGDDLPTGVSFSVFDYGVNSGIGRSGKVLRKVLGFTTDKCTVTDAVIAKAKSVDSVKLIHAINDERIRFLRNLRTFSYFGRGWTTRVSSVRAISLRMAAGATGFIDIEPGFGPGKAYDRKVTPSPDDNVEDESGT